MGDLLSRACGWIAANLDLVAPAYHNGVPPAGDPSARLATLLDVAIVSRALRQHRPSPQAAALAAILLRRISACFPLALTGLDLASRPSSLKGLLWLFGVLRDTQHLDGTPPLVPAMASSYADWTFARGSAFEVLELGYILDLAGLPHVLPPSQGLVTSGALDQVLDPASDSAADAYRVTHTILYLSDLGAAPAADLPSTTAVLAAASVDRLLSRCRDLRHWDLTAELLLCQHVLAASNGRPPDAFSAAKLHAAQREDGSMPEPFTGSSSSLHATLAAILYATATRAP